MSTTDEDVGCLAGVYNPPPYGAVLEWERPAIDYAYDGPIQPGDTSIFCPVCGLNMDTTTLIGDVLEEPPGTEWQDDITIIGFRKSVPAPFAKALEPPEYATWPGVPRRHFPQCDLRCGNDVPTVGVSFYIRETLPLMHFTEDDDEQILFAVHVSCLELARLAFRRYGRKNDLKQLVRCLIYQRRKNLDEKEELRLPDGVGLETRYGNVPPCIIEWDDARYYGLRRKNGQEPTRPSWSLYDPLEAGSITDYVLSLLRPVVAIERPRESPKKCLADMAVIEKLPTELLDMIVSLLPGFSVLSLHNSSKTMQQRIRLPRRFWRDELISGCVSVLFDLDQEKLLQREAESPGEGMEWDWKGLVAELSLLQRSFTQDNRWEDDPGIPRNLRNRCRVWRIARDIQALAARLDAEGRLGESELPYIEGIPSFIPDVKLRSYDFPRRVD